MDLIQLLPDSVANQIAAGEVIQRPSSVVKELVENAVDAGARHIDLLVVDAGKTSIQVVDDGKGMSETDARLAFERHATSKIRQASDLFALTTMGFRGEALPSIAAVSQVTLRTRAEDQTLGTVLNIEGGKLISQEIDASAVGSSFLVQNLFFNVPARRKFLKSNQTELSNIVQEWERIVLVNPDIQFSFHSNGNLQNTYPSGTLRQRVASVFGKKMCDGMLEVNVETTLCQIYGFVGRPDSARKRGVPQYFFVNGRYMRHPYFQKAVMAAFDNLIPASEQIPFFLYFTVDPASIDVNIHPTKTEIKFENEQAIWQILMAAVRESLGKFNAVPIIEFDSDSDMSEVPVFDSRQSADKEVPRPRVDVSYNPFKGGSAPRSRSTLKGWEELYAQTPASQDAVLPSATVAVEQGGAPVLFGEETPVEEQRSYRHLQYRGQYILTETSRGLTLIDQRRAHVRVLYNRYMQEMEGQHGSSQRLLFPEVISLSGRDAAMIEEAQDDLHALGLEVSFLGAGSFSVLAVPAELHGQDLQQLFESMAGTLGEGVERLDNELRHRVSLTIARSAAIPVGQALTQAEMEQLVSDLYATPNPNLTPDGQTIISLIPHERLSKLF